jgi:hypothetical protein
MTQGNERSTIQQWIVGIGLAVALAAGANAQQGPQFTPGNLVVVVEGCGVYRGTCLSVPNGNGTGAGNSSVGGYGDNQAAPLTLFQFAPNGTASVSYVNSFVLPQTASGANLPVSGEYGSSSEGTLQLSGSGQYLTLAGYGINAATFNANPAFYGAAPSLALAQSGSLSGQSYTPVARVIALIDAYGNVNSSTALYNVFNTNNPRSVYSANGTAAYISGQGTGCDLTGGVFYTALGVPNSAPTAITGGDAVPTSSCVASGYTGSLVAQDTRTVQIYGNTLYLSVDSTEGKSDNRFHGPLFPDGRSHRLHRRPESDARIRQHRRNRKADHHDRGQRQRERPELWTQHQHQPDELLLRQRLHAVCG